MKGFSEMNVNSAILLPFDFFLGRVARAALKRLDDNPHELPKDGIFPLIEAVDSIGTLVVTDHNKLLKVVKYIESLDPYYQWLMGYRHENLRLARLKQHDAALNEKFYNKNNFQKGIHFNDEL